jgi:phosphoadenosine phosphosulfate reductase
MDENDDAQKLTNICQLKSRIATNPIIDWTDADIWQYIKQNNIAMNPLYEQGFTRVGCIGCPMNTKAAREFRRYPKYKAAYIRAFERMRQERERRGKDIDEFWASGEAVFRWWTEPKYNPSQIELFDGEGL